MTDYHNQIVWIVGASAGIGAALARELSKRGATLILSARNENDLQILNESLGGKHHVFPLDVSNAQASQTAITDIITKLGKIDRVVFTAAIYRPNEIAKTDLTFAKKMIDVNFFGAVALTHAVLPVFKQQKSGQLALCASVAAFTGLPGGQPYSATKAAILNFAESLHAESDDHIDIKVICPGFVRTRMTDKNQFHMPMRIEPEQAATEIANGLLTKKFEIHFPKRFTYLAKFLEILPYSIKLFVTRKMRGKA